MEKTYLAKDVIYQYTMNNLQISIIQPDLVWESRNANLDHIAYLISEIEETGLIILPEMFATGFTMNAERFAEAMDGPTLSWMKEKAVEKGAAITGSIIAKEGAGFFNRLLWVTPGGEVKWYDKRHLFTMGEENLHYSPGNKRLIVDYKGWRICPLICYDLRFPAWSRNRGDYDLLIYVANWPSVRQHVWKTLLVARAIENQAYVAGVNRVGSDPTGVGYEGGSAVVDAKGGCTFLDGSEQVKTFTISLSELQSFREKFPVLNDRDDFEIKIN